MAKGRAIQTPGDTTAEPAEGTEPGAADDLAQYDSDSLPATPAGPTAGMSPELMDVVNQAIANGVAKALAAQGMTPKGKAATTKVLTVAEAAAICESMVQKGIRPRALLTDQGHYCHPEMARTKDYGVSTLDVSKQGH
jgi:hypothetical protein